MTTQATKTKSMRVETASGFVATVLDTRGTLVSYKNQEGVVVWESSFNLNFLLRG